MMASHGARSHCNCASFGFQVYRRCQPNQTTKISVHMLIQDDRLPTVLLTCSGSQYELLFRAQYLSSRTQITESADSDGARAKCEPALLSDIIIYQILGCLVVSMWLRLWLRDVRRNVGAKQTETSSMCVDVNQITGRTLAVPIQDQ